jgi:hypothetical protein
MLHYELAKARQADLLREAADFHAGKDTSSQLGRAVHALARRVFLACRDTVVNLGETRPIQRRASAWLNLR